MAPRSTLLAAAAAAALLSPQASNAFVVPSAPAKAGSGVAARAKLAAQSHHRTSPRVAFRSTTSKSALYSTSTDLPEISTMRVGELKQELESYGLSTKSFFEKSELVDALTKARAEGKTPFATSTSTDGASGKKKKKKVRSESAEPEPSPPTGADREKRLAEEMEKCQSMKASELKTELQSLGVSTKSFFEKSEFVKALAEARVDGVKKTSAAGGGSVNEEGYAEYKAADVEVLTDDRSGPRKKSREGAGGPGAGGAGASPFGGGGMPGGMPGGMGGMDMGNIGDMLKNMGMGGGSAGGANPFGGAGGSTPFGGANPFSGGMPGGDGRHGRHGRHGRCHG